MLNLPATRRLTAAIAASTTITAHASTLSSNCSASGDSFKCHLHQFLNLLYVLAALLGTALIVVLVLTYMSYRKNKQHPKDDV